MVGKKPVVLQRVKPESSSCMGGLKSD